MRASRPTAPTPPRSTRTGKRLRAVDVELDRCWDLLRQRRALPDAGGDPDDAQARNAEAVERYLQ